MSSNIINSRSKVLLQLRDKMERFLGQVVLWITHKNYLLVKIIIVKHHYEEITVIKLLEVVNLFNKL